jgi:trehalose 6-phosphate phosphatase
MFVSPTATMVQALEPLRSDPAHGAVLLDVDGTLAPIVERAEDAQVPESTRSVLIELTKSYGLVACVSGRRAQQARQIVAIGSIAYVGNHGGELLAPGSTEVQLLEPVMASWGHRAAAFAQQASAGTLRGMRVRCEDKGAVVAFHWRGARDEDAAAVALQEVGKTAEEEGFAVHWGRKVLEVRPPVKLDKGLGIAALFRNERVEDVAGAHAEGDGIDGGSELVATAEPGITAAVYVGDDRTDVDAFNQLRTMVAEGTLQAAVCVAVASEEAPAELVALADVVLDGPGEVRAMLSALL